MNTNNVRNKAQIQILPTELANQIAAGEVVERPASVLKELVENSLDAEATSISAIIEDGGQACIKVIDDGKGISKDELVLAVTRHATSKVKNISDLSTINSFGFRGEALPSIASVSRFRIASKNIDDEQAYALDVLFADMQEVQPCSLQRGTQVEVRDLFNNIPARLKFLKMPSTELKKAQEIFTRIALIHQSTGFSFFAGTREALSFLPKDSLYERICKVWSPSITQHLLEVDENIYDINISGLVSNPRSLYSKADKLFLYVNNRPVTDKVLIRSVRQAYRNSLTTKDYPQVILNLTIDPEEVDVNVHPAKSEVRFRDEQRIFKAVHVAVEKALSQKLFLQQEAFQPDSFSSQYLSSPVQSSPVFSQASLTDFSHSSSFTSNRAAETNYTNEYTPDNTNKNANSSTQEVGFWGRFDEVAFDEKIPLPTERNNVSYSTSYKEDMPIPKENKLSEVRDENIMAMPEFLCQIAYSYLLFRLHSGDVFVLDQHAVHERILYERLSKKQHIESQKLLLPLTIALHSSEVDSFYKLSDDFTRLGFNCVYNEQDNYLTCYEIPYMFQFSSAEKFIKDALKNEKTKIDSLFMDHACDLAIKANQRLSNEEVNNLYKQWVRCEMPDFCPHGRPCYRLVDRDFLDKLFKR